MRQIATSSLVLMGMVGLLGCGGGGGGGGGGDGTVPQQVVVAGRVIDIETGAGVPGAVVSVGGVRATTDSDGSYRMTGVAAGTRSVNVTPPTGYTMSGELQAQRIASGENLLGDIYLVRSSQEPPDQPSL